MKEFKKWWINHNKEGHPDSVGFQFDSEVWKAALECVQNIACKGGILQNDFVIRKWIREELEK